MLSRWLTLVAVSAYRVPLDARELWAMAYVLAMTDTGPW
jgi:hypothetical protein